MPNKPLKLIVITAVLTALYACSAQHDRSSALDESEVIEERLSDLGIELPEVTPQ